MLALLVLLATPQQPAQGPVRIRYRFDSNTEMSMDMAAIMAGMRSAMGLDSSVKLPDPPALPPVRTGMMFTMTARDSGEGRAAHIVVDSVIGGAMASVTSRYDSLPPAQRDSLKARLLATLGDLSRSAQGEYLDLYAVPGRQVVTHVSPGATGSADMGMLQQVVTLLFPPMKLGTTPGQSWVDTVSADTMVSTMGLEVAPKTQVVTRWKMLTPDSYEADIQTSSSMDAGGIIGSAEGGGTGKSRIVVDKARYVVESGSSTSLVTEIKNPMLGDTKVTMTIYSTVTLKRIR